VGVEGEAEGTLLTPAEAEALAVARAVLLDRAHGRTYRASHPEEVRERRLLRQRAWRDANRERYRENARRWNRGPKGKAAQARYLAARPAAPRARRLRASGWLAAEVPNGVDGVRAVAPSLERVEFPQPWPLSTALAPQEAAERFAGAACDPDPWWA